jgi:hypothetical protein
MRTRTSFQKRQKEIARAEKQRDKAAKRLQKKLLAKQGSGAEAEPDAGELSEAPDAPAPAPGSGPTA